MKQETISSKTSAIDLVVGDLMCVRKVSLSLSDSINEWMLSGNTYKERALNVMEEHQAFSGQSYIGIANNEEYVTREAIISCSLGTRHTKLGLCEDHGIIAANQKPLMTCEDCKIFRNISSFDRCKGNPPTIDNLCIPRITKAWIQQEGHLYIFDVTENKYVDALRSSAYLTCRYGGLITVKEVPMKEESQDKGLLPLESKWLDNEWESRGWSERKPTIYVTKDNLKQLGWEGIQDYYIRTDTGDKWDWTKDHLADEVEQEIEKFEEYKSAKEEAQELSEEEWEDLINEVLEHIPFKKDAPEIKANTRSIEDQDIINLNRVLELFNITSFERICAFIAQCTLECDRGKGMCERSGKGETNKPDSYTRHDMAKWYVYNMNCLYQYRGGGAIHVTGTGNYKEVEKRINEKKLQDAVDGDDVSDTASEVKDNAILGTEYIAFTYPWLSAGIYWDMNNINEALQNGGIDGVTLVIQPRATEDSKQKRSNLYEKCTKIIEPPTT